MVATATLSCVRAVAPAVLMVLAACGAALAAAEQGPDAPGPSTLRVFPPSIQLDSRHDVQRIVVEWIDDEGQSADVTEIAELTTADPGIAVLESFAVRPVADGETELIVRHAGNMHRLPVLVKRSDHVPSPSFRRDVVPVLSRAGCNRGACHGSPQGRDGFRLSFQGYDPASDLYRIVSEQPGRRVNLTSVDDSLLLRKALGEVPHGGGKLLDRNDAAHLMIRRWLESGAPDDVLPEDSTGMTDAERSTAAGLHPASLEVFPSLVSLPAGGARQRFIVLARFVDGSDADVTSLARFKSSHEPAAPVSAEGVVTTGDSGLTLVSAAFGTLIVGASVYVAPTDASRQVNQDYPPGGNYVDEAIYAHLRRLRMPAGPDAGDQAFLRRAYLDLTGRLPTPEEQSDFLVSTSPQRRAELVDRLLASEEFADLWTLTWADLLQMRSHPPLGVSFKGTQKYRNWIREQVAANRPIDAIVHDLLTASGSGYASPATHFYQYETDPLNAAENVAQSFLGLRLKCAKCHNHPFDVWTMDDYYGFAAFFGRIERKRGSDPREKVVSSLAMGEIEHPLHKQPVAPRFLGGGLVKNEAGDRREILAAWITSAENPFFARTWANRIWAHFFGVGLVEPLDDARFSNPPTIPALLDALEQRLIASGFDTRALMRDICQSQAYQRASAAASPSPELERSLAVFPVRRLRAEVLLDCLSQATESPEPLAREPLGTRAVTLADGSTTTFFLSTFGRSTHRTVCACEVKSEPTLSQALHLLNGAAVHGKIAEGGLIQRRIDAGISDDQLIRELYRRTLCREPNDADWAAARAVLAEVGNRQEALEDIFWTLLNSHEFLFVY
jgi:hypothetical protein